MFSGPKDDGEYVEFDLGTLKYPLKCYIHGSQHSSGCPGPTASGGHDYFDSPSTNVNSWNIQTHANWWLIGKNGNRWSDPGRCWEPNMDGSSFTTSDGYVLSQDCTEGSAEAGRSKDTYYLYVGN